MKRSVRQTVRAFAGTGGTFFISVQSWSSLGVYTLIIETEGVDSKFV